MFLYLLTASPGIVRAHLTVGGRGRVSKPRASSRLSRILAGAGDGTRELSVFVFFDLLGLTACQEKPRRGSPEAEEHRPERGRVTHKGGATTLRGEGEPVTISRAAYEKSRRLWTRGWELRGEALVNAAAEAHRWIQFCTERREGTPNARKCAGQTTTTCEDIVVDLAGLLMQTFGDIGNRSERYKDTCTLEDPGLFAGEQER